LKPVEIARSLSRDVEPLAFGPPVTHVYNPLAYAWAPHRAYLERFARAGIEALLLGMNPGPFGMAQTGVPFGDVGFARDWLGLEAAVGRPAREHEKRPIEGFACARREGSGQRLWGWAKQRFERPEVFFERFFVWNYCPLCFLEEGGKNRTPDKLAASERSALYTACDRALVRIVQALKPKLVIGVGRFAEARARAALGDRPIGTILHPSPASPAANRGWAAQAERELAALGLKLPTSPPARDQRDKARST
jgi:single-strand selective monofunctional uracil DNA glycosylase